MFHKKSPAELEPLKTLMVVTNITLMLLKTLTTAYAQLLVSNGEPLPSHLQVP